MGYAVEIPEEPADRTVVLDRDAYAWQRRVDGQVNRWHSAGSFPCSWALLLIDRGPLTKLITEGDCADSDGWARAGYASPDCEKFVQPADLDTRVIADERTGELTDDQRDDALATHGQAIDYREIDQRVIGLKHAAGACASTWQLTDDPDGGVTSRVTRAYPAGDEG